ncbi:MAG: aminomethyl-transferring glycine dehydrogenase [Bowdeniella nasicola]|nr:aminomethyl-transferring glycine dehydrogenase [Bowdeniella nasicola]
MTAFADRHLGPTGDALTALLSALDLDSLEDVIAATVPADLRTEEWDAGLPDALSPANVMAQLAEYASRNTVNRSLIGQGYYNTRTPAVIQRNVLENPAWYTAYTPYQPEISQGRLEALVNFQTMVAELTGTDVAGASMLDEGTAVAEAIAIARRASRKGSRVLVDSDLFATTLDVVRTRTDATDVTIEESDLEPGVDLYDTFAVVIQYPGASGRVRPASEIKALAEAAHGAGALVIVVQDLLAATLLPSAGSLGADIAAGTTQRFGVPMGYGGPHAGYLSVADKLKRQLPGRLVGVSKDADGFPAYRLALQTREQHIRREKATSNICTAQVLLAVMASMYGIWHGPEGLAQIARDVHDKAVRLATGLADVGVAVRHHDFFDTLEIDLGASAEAAVDALYERGILVYRTGCLLRISVDELTETATLDEVIETLAQWGESASEPSTEYGLGVSAERDRDYMTHPVFSSYRTETQLMRYLRRLSDQDYALDRGMIPLGSCTMKLNSAVEMAAITWPEFAGLHPLCPREDAAGYAALIDELTGWLEAVTGYECGSLQPNSGAQGEFAGLLAIRGYHASRGNDERRVCLIPASAHGTNAASAVLAGLRVVVVACDENGNVDLTDLREKTEAHRDELACIMITYPSTHGVYEADVREVCEIVHEAGGQVYIDGANLNALVAVARPGQFGGDVSHLNLHKTFAIPHGGGGPGVGPVLAREHLRPFLPGHRVLSERKEGAVSSAPYGSASILPITWAYLRLLGADGLRRATATAVASANYVSRRLRDYYPTLYTGADGWVAHECILDLRPLKAETGITVDDVAKRLMDYGFHAPTMSFPVPGTLMVEPTESEHTEELDRFCEAMILIHEEAMKVRDGHWPKDDNPLVNAPHTAQCVIEGEWTHPYSRETAVYAGALSMSDRGRDRAAYTRAVAAKYWPPVRRIDGAWGDRNLTCSCPPLEAYGSQD